MLYVEKSFKEITKFIKEVVIDGRGFNEVKEKIIDFRRGFLKFKVN